MQGRKNKNKKTAVASSVSLKTSSPKEQLQAEMQSLGYLDLLFIYNIHANNCLSHELAVQ